MIQADESMEQSIDAISGIDYCVCYVDDFDKAKEFYGNLLGLQMSGDHGSVIFYEIGKNTKGLMICNVQEKSEKQIGMGAPHSAFVFRTGSTRALMKKLKDHGVDVPTPEPFSVGKQDDYYFQFYDPSGNLLEAIGKK